MEPAIVAFTRAHRLSMPVIHSCTCADRHRIVFRPHATFSVARCAYGGRALGIARLRAAIEHDVRSKRHDIYGAILIDYDYDSGQGDVLEIAGGQVTYHVGYSDKSDPLPESAKRILKHFHSEFAKRDTIPR